jgi:hypothetical protein
MEEEHQIEEQPVAVSNEEPSFTYISDEEVAQAQTTEEKPTQVDAPVEEQTQQETPVDQVGEEPENQQYAPDEIENAVFQFLSERLGRDVESFDDLQVQQQEQRELDERISVIADFVEKTGRDPRDWFVYQSMNPSEMDDMTVIQVQMASDYPNLSQEEVSLLVSSKYKLDPDLHSEDEVKLSQLQMKMDASGARKGIEGLRSQYQAPEQQEAKSSSLIDDNWISSMKKEVTAMEGIEFDLGNGNNFTFGLDDNYKGQLAEKNTRLDEYFDSYVRKDGSWDHQTLNIHRAVVDNMENIVKSVYRQGISDGHRGLVDKAANVSPQSPNQGNAPDKGDGLAQQLKEILRPNGGLF